MGLGWSRVVCKCRQAWVWYGVESVGKREGCRSLWQIVGKRGECRECR